ncbi:MAG: chitobiase/beta-hexosaminidase C-terminal domain-containing protein [Bacteroidaceae bacterium]|nr:chitobiase/beta-hexosaminidase C-terminal domain-containing protein [Bacteroidaceae bacterium]
MNRLISIVLACLLQASLAVASTFNLSVEVTPLGAGSLNTSGGTYEQGSSVYLRTYANTGYVFKGWYEGDKLLTSSSSYNYTMPSKDVLVQARYEYDPTVPDNPAMPDTTTYYLFEANVSPVGAGSLNTSSGKYAAGEKVNLRAYNNTGFLFVGWQNEVGETVSTSTSFNYTMPRHNSKLTAVYVYDPSEPANPDSMATCYTVTVDCKPAGSGTFNTTSATVEEGGNVRLYAYTNTGFKFLRWENEAGETISTAQSFYYIMPHGNSKVYGIFEYDPAVPDNPNKNYWNMELGEVIVDDFTPGSLNSAISAVIGGSSSNDVAMITVAGVMNSNDFGIANNYSNCTLLDLSRVTGITEVPSYAFDYTNLESVYLPATIENIGYRAFYDCERLSSLIIYAMTPPTLENQVFTYVPEGLVIYVPATAVAQYQDAEGWKDYTILPIQEDIRSISVSLPTSTNPQDYAQMWLELTNIKSGQRMHYVMTDRMQYTFGNIIRNTTWNIVLRNERGDVFGQIDNVEVQDEDVSVTFTSLSKPQNVSLSVLTPEGQDVTDQTQVTWTDAHGNYVAQGTSLTGLPVGYQTNYRVVLSQELAMTYVTPQEVNYTLTDENNNITCQLSAIPQVQLSGKVKDMATGLPLSGAIISASQTFGGKYSKTLSAKTDKDGVFTMEVSNVPTSVAFAASDYISQTVNYDNGFDGLEEFIIPDVSLKSITGAIITVGLTYTTVEGETQDGYSDYNNVGYTIYNETKQHAISQFNVQYPRIVLLEEVDDGDVLKLTASSRTNSFKPVESTATITEQKAEISFAIKELGKIQATFTTTGNASVVGSLYDSSGKLVKTYNYSNASLTISNLADGQYTLVSMGSSRLFNTIYDLAQLPQTGLAEGADYVKNTVEVQSGAVSRITIEEVPALDESKLYYTGDNTSFSVNKPSIVAGNYLTLTGHIDFKPAYATSVSNVQMIVDLPESYSIVENSVMIGNSTTSYTVNSNQITIPMVRYTDRVRFCVIPTLGGNYAPSALVQFDLNNETVTQPIGSAPSEIKDIEIVVPSSTASEHFRVSGKAESRSSVNIYIDGILASNVEANAVGDWSTECQLIEPQNFSTHNVYAIFEKASRPTLTSETKEIVYNPLDIHVNNVEMTFWNAYYKKQYSVIWDFISGTTNCSKYDFYTETEMTFLIDIAYHDIKLIPFVWLHVHTSDGKVRSLRADYDGTKDRWIATDRFSSASLPTQVSVTVENMMFDPSADVSYEILMDEYVGDITYKETIKEEDGSSTSCFTDGNGNDIATVTAIESELTPDELIEKFKQEGFEEDESLNDHSDYVPEDEDDTLDEDVKVLIEPKSGSLVFIGSATGGSTNAYAAIVRVIREEDRQESSPELVSTTITRNWKSFYRTYLEGCNRVTEYKNNVEYLDRYVKVITSTLVSRAVFIDYRVLPPGTKVPDKIILGKIKRTKESAKRRVESTIERKVVPIPGCPPPPPPPIPPIPPVPPVLDPSGYVYEGVASNRVQGATATVFYKERVEDMYGDLHENIVKWNAEEYAQENPLFTDEYGMYQWDVPQGLWQVKFEKEGYETTYSDWLPVPPPQLEVNIAMKQARQPEVKMAHAFEDAVEMEFDKYMMSELLTTENISVIQDGNAVEGTIELLNEETSYVSETETFASKIRFIAAQPFTEKEVTLLVNNRVKSYAGIRMHDNYQQKFTVEQEIKEIQSDSLMVVNYGENAILSVSVLPASASKGKLLTVKTSSPMILGVETEQVIIDEDGKAEITVSGELPGTAALTFSVEGTDKEGQTIVSVEINNTVATPTASIASGSIVEKGTQVELSCATEGATIFYTLDGSCPCVNSEARKVYDGTPITIDKNTVIKAMAAAPDMEESEVATFVYIITPGDLNDDGKVDIADAVTVLNIMAKNEYNEIADVNHDQKIDIADFVTILNIMAAN